MKYTILLVDIAFIIDNPWLIFISSQQFNLQGNHYYLKLMIWLVSTY